MLCHAVCILSSWTNALHLLNKCHNIVIHVTRCQHAQHTYHTHHTYHANDNLDHSNNCTMTDESRKRQKLNPVKELTAWWQHERNVFRHFTSFMPAGQVVAGFHHSDIGYDEQAQHCVIMDIKDARLWRGMQHRMATGEEGDVIDRRELIGVDGYLQMANDAFVPTQVKLNLHPVQTTQLGSFMAYTIVRDKEFPEQADTARPLLLTTSGITPLAQRTAELMRFDHKRIPDLSGVEAKQSQSTTAVASNAATDTADYSHSHDLRPAQQECLDKYFENSSSQSPFLIAMAPGTGKTTVMQRIIEEFYSSGDLSTVIICSPTRFLTQQTSVRMAQFLTCSRIPHEITVFDSDTSLDVHQFDKAANGLCLILSTYQSSSLLTNIVNSETMIFFDEAHNLNEQTRELYEATADPVLMTGTPRGITANYVSDCEDSNKFELGLRDSIAAGYLCPYRMIVPRQISSLAAQEDTAGNADERLELSEQQQATVTAEKVRVVYDICFLVMFDQTKILVL